MKIIALIPARYAASRFPGKLMQRLGGQTVIWRTYQAAVNTGLFAEVAVVCDSDIIFDEIMSNGGKAIMSQREHECGTDRIAEVAHLFQDADILVNVQGDEPFTQKEPLEQLLKAFTGADGAGVQVASMKQRITDQRTIEDPNCVKVVTDIAGNALLFSRSVIPYHRDKEVEAFYYKHIGIYAFRPAALQQFANWSPGMLERLEKQEGMRFLENGISIRMVETDYINVGIDTPDDLIKAEKLIG